MKPRFLRCLRQGSSTVSYRSAQSIVPIIPPEQIVLQSTAIGGLQTRLGPVRDMGWRIEKDLLLSR